ncbi:DUF6268 family outer membrane beta-barrel protein [Haloferula sp.]|uniref:DUF6268 family outer membrane beta-barrel protein n=1 Tax=Haloferula sp. TaxID=2497595 RepID=UPI003C783992
MQSRPSLKLISAALACGLALPAWADKSALEPQLSDPYEFDISRFIDVLNFRAVYSSGMELDNSPVEFDFTELSLAAFLTKPLKLGGDWSAIAYLNFEASQFEFDGNPPIGTVIDDIESDLYRIGVPIVVLNTSANSPWSYGAWISPSISSDFDHVDSDDFFLDVAIAAAYQVNDKLLVGGGVFASDILHDPFVIPGIGFVWTPREDWLVSFYGPRFVARRDINDRNQIGFEITNNGGLWNIDSGNASRRLDFSSWRSGLYYRYNVAGEIWLHAAAGFTFANELQVQTRDGTDLFPNQLGDADPSPYVSLGISLARW